MRPAGLLLAVVLLGGVPAGAQLSPGPLSRAHARLEGSANCLKCHQPGKGATPERCLSCHTPLQKRIAAGKGLHARPEYRQCKTCHNEHHGRDFQLIHWGKQGSAGFDHRQTGFALAGAHAALACRACHQPRLIRNPRELQNANPSRTFLGLGTACLSCHKDEHRGQLGTASCLSCHDQKAWKPARGFDHGRTKFPLTGQHASVACASCHPAKTDAAGSFLQLKGIQHASCANCHHRDPHQGRFGANCQQCHSTAGWKSVDRSSFDHDRTGFPLTGRHRSLPCASCHRGPTFTKMAHQRCTDCHKDPHQGRFGATCQSCHTTAGWKTGTARSGFNHDKTRFPLRGEHRQVACQSCHGAGRTTRIARFQQCADCHKDVHLGQFKGQPCESCHTVEGFKPSTFTLEKHQKTSFPLKGSHLAVPCISCHRPQGPSKTIQFHFTSTACLTCHGDPHRGEVKRFVVQGGCETCHSLESWKSVIFDHDRTGFPLEGGHQRVACRSCHPTVERGTPRERIRFQGTPSECASCHGDPHGGQLVPTGQKSAGAVRCQACHSVVGWGRVTFDHDRSSRFRLEGAHRNLPCAACHKPETRQGRTVVRYKPLPTTCEGCHGGRQGATLAAIR